MNFDKTGKITTDLTVAPQTKNELKEAYGMKVASGIGLEWYQQAENYAQYALGKTPAELSGLAVFYTRKFGVNPPFAELNAQAYGFINEKLVGEGAVRRTKDVA